MKDYEKGYTTCIDHIEVDASYTPDDYIRDCFKNDGFIFGECQEIHFEEEEESEE